VGAVRASGALEPNPDHIVDRLLDTCPRRAAAWPDEPQTPQQVYDRIELTPVKPDVTRVRLFGGRCACCGERAVASASAGLEPGSPFGKSIEAIAVYLHYGQAIGIERLRLVFSELFGLSISEGALCNILARAQAPLEASASSIATLVTSSDVVASDETSVRVMKKTCWEWVFITAVCVLHIIRPSRGAGVVRALFGEARPRVWISDSLGSQRGHADIWQVCLAHLLRDAQDAIDCGDEGFAAAFRRLLLRAIAIGQRRDVCAARRWSNIAPIWIVGSTACWRCRGVAMPPRSCDVASPATASICSCSSPTAMCPPPTTSASARCVRAWSSAR
jgi:transposase